MNLALKLDESFFDRRTEPSGKYSHTKEKHKNIYAVFLGLFSKITILCSMTRKKEKYWL